MICAKDAGNITGWIEKENVDLLKKIVKYGMKRNVYIVKKGMKKITIIVLRKNNKSIMALKVDRKKISNQRMKDLIKQKNIKIT